MHDGSISYCRRLHARGKIADGVGPTPAVSDRARRLFTKLLLDDLYDAVYFVDPERRIRYWNHAAEALSGYPASEVLRRRCSTMCSATSMRPDSVSAKMTVH